MLLSACSDERDEFAPERAHSGLTLDTQDWGNYGVVTLVRMLDESGPAAAAGLQSSDLIRRVDGRTVRNAEEVYSLLERKRLGQLLKLEVDRFTDELKEDGSRADPKKMSFTVRLAEERPPSPERLEARYTGVRFEDQYRLGLGVAPITRRLADHYGIESPKGVLVTTVFPLGSLPDSGIAPGDVIVSFAGQEVSSMAGLRTLISRVSEDLAIPIGVKRGEQELSFTLGALGPDVPGANFIPVEARFRLQRAIARRDLHPSRLVTDIRPYYWRSDPTPGEATMRIGAISRVSRDSISIEVYSTGREWTLQLGPQTEAYRGDAGSVTDLRTGEFIRLDTQDGRTAWHIFSLSFSLVP